MDVGVDEIGQRGWLALHNCPWGIAKTEYFVKSGVVLVQIGAGNPFGVSVPCIRCPSTRCTTVR